MSGSYYVLVTIHVLAALLWLGGMLFLGVVGAPVLRAIEPPALRQRLFNELGRRFRTIGWIAIATLVVTGVLLLRARDDGAPRSEMLLAKQAHPQQSAVVHHIPAS